jgi:hypothetical protein
MHHNGNNYWYLNDNITYVYLILLCNVTADLMYRITLSEKSKSEIY